MSPHDYNDGDNVNDDEDENVEDSGKGTTSIPVKNLFSSLPFGGPNPRNIYGQASEPVDGRRETGGVLISSLALSHLTICHASQGGGGG